MPLYNNKGELKSSLVSWLAEGQPEQQTLDQAIALTEADLRRRLRVLDMERTDDIAIIDGQAQAPARFLAVRLLQIDEGTAARYVSPELLASYHAGDRRDRSVRGTSGEGSDQIWFFTLEGRENMSPIFRFYPLIGEIDRPVMATLRYIVNPSLERDGDTNGILDKWPDAYHYGSLAHLADYVRNKERLPDWEGRYQAILDKIETADQMDKTDGSILISRSVYRGF